MAVKATGCHRHRAALRGGYAGDLRSVGHNVIEASNIFSSQPSNTAPPIPYFDCWERSDDVCGCG